MRSFIKKILPASVLEAYRQKKKAGRAAKMEAAKARGLIQDENSLFDLFRKCGIKEGDVLMLHSSLSSLGFVKGGAEAVIQAALRSVGDKGTLVMPSFPAQGFNYDHLMENRTFDLRNTPSATGKITEVFRNRNGVVRSLHPTDPVIAFGPRANELVNEHFGQPTPYNDKSPFYKMCLLNAKIILLGVDLNSLTHLHTLEDAVKDFPFPVYHDREFECEMIGADGTRKMMKTKVHDPKWSKQRRCNELIPLFRQYGCLKEQMLGETRIFVIEAGRMQACMLEAYRTKGITMYTPQGRK